MPLYEYQCDKCGELFEVIQKFADAQLTVHEKCGGSVHRLLSVPSLQFKGSGWYVNDYAKGSGSSEKSGDSKGEPSVKTESSNSSGKDTASKSSSEAAKPSSSSDKK